MTDMAPATVSAFKRAMAHGTPIRIDNRLHPAANRDTVVLTKTNTVDLVTAHPEAPRGSHIGWPKKGGVVHDGVRTWGLVGDDGAVWLTVTVLDAA